MTARRRSAPIAAGAILLGCSVLATACSSAGGPEVGTTTTSSSAPAAASASATSATTTGGSDRAQDGLRQLDADLIAAAWDNDVARARALIEAGADVNAKDATVQSAYLVATSEGYLELLDLTLANGADVASLDSFNGTGLIRAAERGHARVVGRLLQAGIDVDHMNRLGWTALHEAIILGRGTDRYVDTVRLLVAGGADLRLAPLEDGIAPLDHADARRQVVVATTLRTALETPVPADPDRALLAAAAEGDADRVAIALRAGADLETRDERRRTALLIAASEDHVEVARLLVALGADANAVDDRRDTPWLVTGVTGSVAMGEVLLGAGADLRLRNRFGGISVIPASERGHVDYVRWVVGTGIDVNHVNDLGWTALLEAVILGDGSAPYQEIVRILLAAGAYRAIADRDGVTALEHARRSGQSEVAALLGSAG